MAEIVLRTLAVLGHPCWLAFPRASRLIYGIGGSSIN